MQSHKLQIYQFSDLQNKNNDELLKIANSLGIDITQFTSVISSNRVVYTHEQREKIIKAILGKNPKISEADTKQLQRHNKIYFWCMIMLGIFTLLFNLYQWNYKQIKITLDQSIQQIDMPKATASQETLPMFNVSKLTYGPIEFGDNFRLRGKILQTTDRFYMVDFSASIRGLSDQQIKIPKESLINEKVVTQKPITKALSKRGK